MRKQWLSVVALSALAMGAVVGCGTSGSTGSSTNTGGSTGSNGPVTLNLGMWSSSPAEKQLVQNQINLFEKSNPNIKVNIQVINGNYLQAIQPMLASHTAPDIFYVDSSYAPQLEQAGVLMSLDNYIQKDHVDLSAFSPSLLQAFQWKGQTYGLPKDFNTLALEYNKSLLAKAGISQPPATWTQFEQDAKALKAKGIAPLSMPVDVARYYPFIVDAGGSYYDSSTNQATFTNSANQAGVKFFLDNLHKGYFVTPQDLGATWAGPPFAQGKVAMVLEGAWLVPFMQQSAPKLQYGVAGFPSLDGKDANMVYTVSYSMSKFTKHPNSAAKLLFFMTGDQALQLTADSGLAIPSRTSEQGLFTQKYPNYQAFIDGVKNAVPYQFGTLGQNFVDAINSATQAGQLKNLSPAQVLQQAQQTLQSQQQSQ